MGSSFSSDTIRFRAHHKGLSLTIANFESFFRFIFLLKDVEVRISALIAWKSTIRSFVEDSFLEEIKASCLSIRDFYITKALVFVSETISTEEDRLICQILQILSKFSYIRSGSLWRK